MLAIFLFVVFFSVECWLVCDRPQPPPNITNTGPPALTDMVGINGKGDLNGFHLALKKIPYLKPQSTSITSANLPQTQVSQPETNVKSIKPVRPLLAKATAAQKSEQTTQDLPLPDPVVLPTPVLQEKV